MRSPSFDSLLLPLTVGAVFAVALLVALVRSPPIPSWAHVSPEQIAEAKKHGVPVAFENEFGMRFVLIPAGMFLMGSPQEEDGRRDDEAQREVTLTKPFYMQITELTNAQYRAWMPKHSSGKYGEYPLDADTQPAVFVSWHDATTFAMWLSSANRSRRYRLPTEAEWEYTCRAGTTTSYHFGDTVTKQQANFDWNGDSSIEEGEHRQATCPVGSFPPNAWGLHDMHGNVYEWCRDWFEPYTSRPVTDPDGPVSGSHRVMRGGSWMSTLVDWTWAFTGAIGFRAAARHSRWPSQEGYAHDGFRLVSPLPETSR